MVDVEVVICFWTLWSFSQNDEKLSIVFHLKALIGKWLLELFLGFC